MIKRNQRPTKLLWMDLEMTGLDPVARRIIEVGVIITDFDFNELASYEAIIKQPAEVLAEADDWVKANMKPLLGAVANGQDEEQVVKDLLKLVEHHFGDEAVVLAGNSIHQDRRFIRQWWPDFEAKLHYRMLDVSAIKVLMHGKFNIIVEKPEQHRALEDIRGSIDELKNYLGRLGEPRDV